MFEWLRWRTFCWLLKRYAEGYKYSGSRVELTWYRDAFEYKVTRRDMREPDVYGREDVYTFLRTVRENERRMDWKCPEPEGV